MALTVERFYWLPHCSTCQKADQYLKDKGVQIKQYIDVKTQRVPLDEIKGLADKMGGVEALFSKRALKYRALGLDKKTLTEEEMLQHMTDEYTFIKRPVLVASNGRILAGFSAKQYDALIKAG